jgi:hypothetical protein
MIAAAARTGCLGCAVPLLALVCMLSAANSDSLHVVVLLLMP